MPPFQLAEQSSLNSTTKSHLFQKLYSLNKRYWHTSMPQQFKKNTSIIPTEPIKRLPSKKMTMSCSTPKNLISPNTLPNSTKPYLSNSLVSFKSYELLTLLPLSFVSLATSNFTESSTPPNFTPANHLPELSLPSSTLSPNLLPHQSKPSLAKGLTSASTNTECYEKATKINIGSLANILSKLTSSSSNLKTTYFTPKKVTKPQPL
jgi:hypothetical protein